MRFDSARAAGLTEERADRIRDGYQHTLPEAESAALELTDVLIGGARPLPESMRQRLAAHYDEAQIVELALGVGLFLGMSKVLITLGLEPEDMPVTVTPTPGST